MSGSVSDRTQTFNVTVIFVDAISVHIYSAMCGVPPLYPVIARIPLRRSPRGILEVSQLAQLRPGHKQRRSYGGVAKGGLRSVEKASVVLGAAHIWRALQIRSQSQLSIEIRKGVGGWD